MKKVFLLLAFALCFVAEKAISQTRIPTVTAVDSASTVNYSKITASGGYAQLSICYTITKTASVGGAAVAGYAILQGSNNDTNYVPVPTWKYTNWSSVPGNVFGNDTLTLTNTTAAQPKCWEVTTYPMDGHPFLYYRVLIVMTTSKVQGTGVYVLRKKF